MTKIPKKIDHGHIIDSVVEIRFVPKNEHTAFLDILSSVGSLLQPYKYVSAEIPGSIRKSDPQLHYTVEATLVGRTFSLGIGFNSMVFNCQNGYKSWSEFYPFIVSVMEKAGGHIQQLSRVGVRFTNFFEGNNDLACLNVNFNAGKSALLAVDEHNVSQTVLKFSVLRDDIGYNVTIANFALPPKKSSPGILVDVDAYADNTMTNPVTGKTMFDAIEFVHSMEKRMFFSLLEKSFLDSLNPTY